MEKRCGRCDTIKPVSEFAWRRVAKGDRDNYCKPCRAEYKQEHYRKNRRRYIAQAEARRRRILHERMEYVLEFLATHPCVDCGEKDPVVLEFDHMEPKAFDISRGIRNRNWDDVLTEINKCVVRCANCHRRRSATVGRFIRARMTEPDVGD